MDISEVLPCDDGAKFIHVPYEERWKHLKPVITQLYMGKYGPNGKSMTIGQVASFMKENYSFHGAETQYRRWFREWGIRKRILMTEKKEIVSALGRRDRDDGRTPNVMLGDGKELDKKQLKRHLKDEIRRFEVQVATPGVFTSWNLPYAALAKAHGAPFEGVEATLGYLRIHSPEARTPGRNSPPPSPTMQLVQRKLAQDRSSLMLQGRFQELLAGCGEGARVTLTNYFHEFYVHSFVTAKYWGRGPKNWTPDLVSALTLREFSVSPSPTIAHRSSPSTSAPQAVEHERDNPTQLCKWVIHVRRVNYSPIPEPESEQMFDIQNPNSWTPWQQPMDLSLADSMKESMLENTFSATPKSSLPISAESISQSLRQDPEALILDALRMAIMAGNSDAVFDIIEENDLVTEDFVSIHPFHLAAAFLDGGNNCCATFSALVMAMNPEPRFNVDDLGHTILDSLMVSILRSHTTLGPEHVSKAFQPPNRYPGEEKDICGRWDADSPLVRSLFRRGHARVPTQWKHPFCHSSVQGVCHSIIAIFVPTLRPDINFPSGLFTRRCGHCGLELKLGPIHTLVAVAFYLAQLGMPGETLFGPLAVLVCLLRLGARASLSAMVSVDAILGNAETDTCNHNPIDASDLLQTVPGAIVAGWTPTCQSGWKCIAEILLTARQEEANLGREVAPEEDEDDLEDVDQPYYPCPFDDEFDGGIHGEWLRIPRGTPKSSLLWATIQTELLTYRKVRPSDPWISDNFSMDALRAWLMREKELFATPLVEEGLMRWDHDSSCCGWLSQSESSEPFMPVAEQVCTSHFMNMDVYERATFLPQPNHFEFEIECD
ncbi:hypothetical protein B0T14DRAFT_530137 [Immersiella caudata]|uniref:Clr5 domain-containing protein n=1 Tax=Immersiella caudata TaxID=314043 RepID=A0AA39U579_9PEZI|nr:hypothetical protein B0T14DRAFT_530137 [Immersiella caudata]